MKKVQKTLTAALAATLATGIVGSVANAETLTEIYNAAYNATQNALAKKDQVSINEARAAIAKLPAEYKNHASTFSGLVDTVQQPIYVNILTALEKAQKENNQANINAARKMLVGVEQSYANTWSAELDKSQQALIVKTQEACAKAEKSQDAKDIAAAKALLAELKTVELNDGLKATFDKMDTDFSTNLTIFVEKIEVMNAKTLKVTFNKDVNEKTVKAESFVIKTGGVKAYASEVEVEKNVVTVTLKTSLDPKKEYNVAIKGIKDIKGTIMKEVSEDFKYDKLDSAKIELKSPKIARGKELKDIIVVKDSKDRDITEEAKSKLQFSSEVKGLVTKDGRISASAKLEEHVITVKSGEYTQEVTVTVVKNTKNLAESVEAYTLGKTTVDSKKKLSDVQVTSTIKVGQNSELTLFIKNADGSVVPTNDFDKLEIVEGPLTKVSNTAVRGNKVGTGLVKVTYGELVETIEVEIVKEGALAATLSEIDSISLANNEETKYVPFSLKDASTGAVEKELNGKVYLWDDSKSEWKKSEVKANIAQKGLIELTGKTFGTGDHRVKLEVEYQGEKISTEFNITVVESTKTAASYELVATKDNRTVTELGQNDEAVIRVYALDADGNRIKEYTLNLDDAEKEAAIADANLGSTEFNLEVDGVRSTAKNDDGKAIFAGAKAANSYTLKAKVKNGKDVIEVENSITIAVKADAGTLSLDVDTTTGAGVTVNTAITKTYIAADKTEYTGDDIEIVKILDENSKNITNENVKDAEGKGKSFRISQVHVIVKVKDAKGVVKNVNKVFDFADKTLDFAK